MDDWEGCRAADYLVVQGETEPIADNDTERARELSRLVEVAIYASKEYRAEVAQR